MDVIDEPTADDLVYPPLSWHPRPDQMGVWADLEHNVKNLLVIAHRRWGKDELFMTDCAIHAQEDPANYWYMLPEAAHVRRAIWEAINPKTKTRRIDELFPPAIRSGKIRENEMVIPIMAFNGKQSLVQFLGSDNYNKNVGGSPKGVYVSEFPLCDPKAIGYLRPILGENDGFLRLFGTPRGKNHAHTMMVDNTGKPGWAVHLLPNSKTRVFSEAKIREYLEENIQLYGPEIGQALTEQEYECSFEEIVPGSFYLDLLLKAEREGRIMNLAPRPELPVHAFFDIGFTDPTAIWYVQLTEAGWIDIIDYDEFTITSAPELIPELKKKPWYYGGLYLPHDGAHHEFTSGTSTYKICTAAGFRTEVMPRTDDAAQIPSVRTILPRCRFNHSPAVKRGLECLRHFHNKAKQEGGRTSWSPRPVHDWCLAPETDILTPNGWKNVTLLQVGDCVVTPGGIRCIQRAGIVRWTNTWITIAGVRTTREHQWFTKRGLLDAADVSSLGECWTSETWGLSILAFCARIFRLGFKDAITLATREKAAAQSDPSSCIEWCMNLCMGLFRRAMKSITDMTTRSIITLLTWKHCRSLITEVNINQKSDLCLAARFAERLLGDTTRIGSGALKPVTESPMPQKSENDEPAYDVTVAEDHCYFVKGNDGKAYLVSNSSHGAKAFATLGYFAPELRSGVQPPKKAVSHLYSSPYQGGTGWMS